MVNKVHVNPFEEVHRKVRAFRDHARVVVEEDDARRRRQIQDGLQKDPPPLAVTEEASD